MGVAKTLGKLIAVTCLVAATSASAGKAPAPAPTTVVKTDPTVLLGLAWTFGNKGSASPNGDLGLTLKILSTNKRDSAAAAAGLTWNFGGGIGCDLGLGFNDDRAVLTATWDFCRMGPQIGIGAMAKKQKTSVIGGGGGAAAAVAE